MGFWDIFFGKKKTIQDAFFGPMLFFSFKKDPARNYFECRRHFKPSGNLIEVGVAGDLSGPTALQKDFFQRVEQEYFTIGDKIVLLLESEFRNWKPDFKILHFEEEFAPVYLFLPRCEIQPVIWEIGLETLHDRNHAITVTMKDFEPEAVTMEG